MQHDTIHKVVVPLLVGFLFLSHTAPAQKGMYLADIEKSTVKCWRLLPSELEAWKQSPNHSILWGYNPPSTPIYLAATYGYLYSLNHSELYAERALRLLAEYGQLRKTLPAGFASSRAEYSRGVPAFTNFFFIAPFAQAYLAVRDSRSATPALRAVIEKDLAESVDFVYRFPEWGTHNRAMLRALGFLLGAQALPHHPHVQQWLRTADAIAADNLQAWEVEDATVYHPVWLHTVLRYAEAAERPEVHSSVFMHYYLKYFTHLISPAGLVPDFGDAFWESSLEALRFVAIFERGAAVFHDPSYRWAAASILAASRARTDTMGIGAAYHLCDAHRWTDESIAPKAPHNGSEEVLEDVIGKKVVFRNGWDEQSTYMLLNYRDEGVGGWMSRNYLRNTITVEEEKMHHGHADENSISLLMHHGSVLLHDAGYRDGLPSGPYGAWRQDYFHNRLVVRPNKRDQLQGVLEFVRNSGAYRPVETRKIDFVRLCDVDMSRTRVSESSPGYEWDRMVVYVRSQGVFVIIDAVKATRSDYLTLTSFWHGQNVQRIRDGVYTITVDSLQALSLPRRSGLRVEFLDRTARSEGIEPVSRHRQNEFALYQSISSQYKSGDMETFVTVLTPFDRGTRLEDLPRASLLPTSSPALAVAVRLECGEDTFLIGAKLDLESEIARENIRPRYQYELGKTTYGEFETDAHFLVAHSAGDSTRFSAVNVLKVYQRGKEVMSAQPNTHALQPDGSPDRIGLSKWRIFESDPTPQHQPRP
jgi:hypothetical protein